MFVIPSQGHVVLEAIIALGFVGIVFSGALKLETSLHYGERALRPESLPELYSLSRYAPRRCSISSNMLLNIYSCDYGSVAFLQ